jgi:hypothetical protein
VQSHEGQLWGNKQAVFRARFQVTENDLTAGAAKMNFKMIDRSGLIYVNGQLLSARRVPGGYRRFSI